MPRLRLAAIATALLCFAGGDEGSVTDYPLRAPDNPGGERHGDDDAEDGFDGYPVDPGEPGDSYYDVTEEHRPYSPNWTGAYFGGGLMGGLATVRTDLANGVARAPAYGVFLEWSSVNQILNLQGGYLGTRFSLDTEVGEVTLRRHGVHGAVLAHPLFLAVLNGGRVATTIANWYILVGLGAERFVWDAPPSFEDTNAWQLGWKLGSGVDTYLDSPHDGSAFWIGVQYQFGIWRTTAYEPLFPRERFQEHWVLLRLSYRWNGGFFAGGEGPDVP